MLVGVACLVRKNSCKRFERRLAEVVARLTAEPGKTELSRDVAIVEDKIAAAAELRGLLAEASSRVSACVESDGLTTEHGIPRIPGKVEQMQGEDNDDRPPYVS